MTRFSAVAHRSTADHPRFLAHTFLVETFGGDEAARRAWSSAQAFVRSKEPDAVSERMWVLLCTLTVWNGPTLTLEVRAWQRSWLEQHAGCVDGDIVLHSLKETRVFALDGQPEPEPEPVPRSRSGWRWGWRRCCSARCARGEVSRLVPGDGGGGMITPLD